MLAKVSAHDIRQQLLNRLRSDVDFDAFCIDNFPDIYQRFGHRMDRVQKTNILLEQVSEWEHILYALNLQNKPIYAPGGQGAALRNRPTFRLALILFVVTGAIVVAVMYGTRPIEPHQTKPLDLSAQESQPSRKRQQDARIPIEP